MYSLEHELILLNLRHRITHATRNSRFSHGWDLDPSLMRPKPIIPGRLTHTAAPGDVEVLPSTAAAICDHDWSSSVRRRS
jgi:hypothetical protein